MAEYTKNGPRKDKTSPHGSDYSSKNRGKSGLSTYGSSPLIDTYLNSGKTRPYGEGKHAGGKNKPPRKKLF